MAQDFAVHVLDGGRMVVPRQGIYQHGGPEDLEIPIPSFLIRHPNGDVVFEGGNQVEVAGNPREYWGPIADVFKVYMTPDQHVKAQVEALDVDPDAIKHVITSHLHLDHTGSIGHFKNAKYLLHREELNYARKPDWFSAGVYLEQDFERGTNWDLVDLDEDNYELDLYGDGTIKVIFTPGHSTGHMSVAVALEKEPLILAGDAADARPHYDSEIMPGWFVDGPAVCRSVARLKQYEQDMAATEVIFGHSMEQWRTLKTGADAYI